MNGVEGTIVRAVRNTENGIEIVELPAAEPTNEQVRVRVRAAGICGSDLHLLEWGPMAVTLGHEFAGLLDDDTPVAVAPQTACLECDRCQAGDQHLCRTLLDRTHGVSIDGGLADEVLVDARAVVVLPTGIRLGDAGLVEPLAVAVHGVNVAGLVAGQRVLVVGGGSIGLCAVAAARHLGATADLIARHPRQIAAGDQLGAGHDLVDEYDVVFDAAGSQGALDEAFARVRPGGTVVALATYWSNVKVGLAFTTKEVRFLTSSGYGVHAGEREFAAAATVLAATPDLADALITHRFELADAAKAFRVAADRASGSIKVQLSP